MPSTSTCSACVRPAYLLKEEGDGRIELEEGGGHLLREEPNVDLVDKALAWWESELAAIEAEIAAG